MPHGTVAQCSPRRDESRRLSTTKRRQRVSKSLVTLLIFFATIPASLFPAASAWSLNPSTPNISAKQKGESTMARRDILQYGLIASPFFFPRSTFAADEGEGMMSTSAVATLLRSVPTFTIVDDKGVPFMVVGEDAKVTGYFFTSYGEAARILKAAKTSADKAIKEAKAEGKSDEEAGQNPWKMARISTVPLDSAVTLVSKSSASFGGGNYFRVAPSEQDVEDALALTGQEDLAEGKAPLFYYADFTIDVGGNQRSPLYFRKSELEEQYRKTNPGVDAPKVLVTELFAVLAEMVRPGGKDNDLQTLIFVPPKESERKRKDCEKIGGKEAPFVIGQRIIVL
mmetsp:Transcript_32488/g.92592  ORF Transcript_32488/g.92592 Transcript_32488/m.92592 type:complete len:340 (+) Transcript_32488:74-1093(+)